MRMLKVCGARTLADIELLAAAGADYVGLWHGVPGGHAELSVEEVRASLGADSLGYVSLAGLTAATTLPAGRLCRACFDGNYPVPVAAAERGKHVLEGAGASVPKARS